VETKKSRMTKKKKAELQYQKVLFPLYFFQLKKTRIAPMLQPRCSFVYTSMDKQQGLRNKAKAYHKVNGTR